MAPGETSQLEFDCAIAPDAPAPGEIQLRIQIAEASGFQATQLLQAGTIIPVVSNPLAITRRVAGAAHLRRVRTPAVANYC